MSLCYRWNIRILVERCSLTGYIVTSLHTKVLNSHRLDIQILINDWIFSSMFLNRFLKDKNYDLIFSRIYKEQVLTHTYPHM